MINESIENNEHDVKVNLQIANGQYRVMISVKNYGRPFAWGRHSQWYGTPAEAFAEVPAMLVKLFDGVINPVTYPDFEYEWAYDPEN
jgi:hypothetical protein